MPTKRKWVRYLRGEPNYNNGLRRILPTASGAVRKAIKSADQRHGELGIHDTSHLLVEEIPGVFFLMTRFLFLAISIQIKISTCGLLQRVADIG